MPVPDSICLLRTSAIGDVTHVVPLIRTLQQAWPQTSLTWIIGKLERKLVGDLPGVDFVTFDKSAGWQGMRDVRAALEQRRFDALFQMQVDGVLGQDPSVLKDNWSDGRLPAPVGQVLILLPGSPADLDPEKYGAVRIPNAPSPIRPARQSTSCFCRTPTTCTSQSSVSATGCKPSMCGEAVP